MKTRILLLLLVIAPFVLRAQKKKLTIKQAVVGLRSDLRIKNLSQLQFMGQSNFYAYSHKFQGEQALMYANPITHKVKPFITLTEFKTLLVNNNMKEPKALPRVTWLDEYSFYFRKGNDYYRISNNKGKALSINKIQSIQGGAKVISGFDNMNLLALKKDNNLFVQKGEKLFVVTDDGAKDIVYGEAVHRFEFGITKGIFWSPKGNFLAFYRKDESMVNDYPIVNWSTDPATVKTIKYPMAGGKSHHVTLGVYDINKNKTIYLKTEGPKDQYLTSVSWSPDEQYVYVGVLSRDQKHLKFNKYDAVSGNYVLTVFEDKHERYVEPQHPLNFYNNTPGEFIWLSQRDGFMHMYLYKNDKLSKQITKGNWIVNEILGYDNLRKEILFTSTKDGAMQKNVYAVNMKNLKVRNLSSEGGWHAPVLSNDASMLIERYTNKNNPRIINVKSVATNETIKRLFTAKNTLEDYETARVELKEITTENNTKLYGKLIYPSNFDATKKYPTIVYLYNGPHAQMNRDVFPYTGNLWYDYMATKGYFVFVLDGRGSSNRGFEFESVTHRQLGVKEMEDQMEGIKFLKSLPYIDANRLGIHGWSFGGFMTTSIMTKYPEVFKCGVAGGPVMDWEMYEVMYTERYMDDPTTNPDGYAKTKLTESANKLKNKLLIIHGTQDDVVVWQHSMKFIRNAVKENVQVDYAVYPAHPHNVRGNDRIHLMQKITDYFDLHLQE